jgi:hypothetical protein
MHPKAHAELWTVLFLRTRAVIRFACEEEARLLCVEIGELTPVALIAPAYYGGE